MAKRIRYGSAAKLLRVPAKLHASATSRLPATDSPLTAKRCHINPMVKFKKYKAVYENKM